MKKLLFLTLFLAIVLTFVVKYKTQDYILLDGIGGEINALILKSDTRYAEKYTDYRFSQIKIGMTERQVIAIIGKPLSRSDFFKLSKRPEDKYIVRLQYSESPSSTHYRLRQIYLYKDKVSEIISYFYLD